MLALNTKCNHDDILFYCASYSLPTVVDRVRVVVGQAELLMRKKMKQYLGLVTGAEEQTDGGNTTAEDLQVWLLRNLGSQEYVRPCVRGERCMHCGIQKSPPCTCEK